MDSDCPKCEHVHKKNLFKINRLKNLDSEQKQIIKNNALEIKSLKQELKTANRKLDHIIDIILPHGTIDE